MAITWATFESTVRAAIVSACGLASAESKVIWSHQNGTRPALPYITLRLTPMRTLGIDGTRHTYNGAAPAGTEITLSHGGMREFGLSVQVFGDVLGSTGAVATMEALKSSLNKVTIREALEAAGVSFFDFGQVVDLTQIEDTAFEGRAAMEIRGYTTQEITETLGYIQTVDTTGTISNVTTTEQVDIGSPPPSGVWGSGNVWGG